MYRMHMILGGLVSLTAIVIGALVWLAPATTYGACSAKCVGITCRTSGIAEDPCIQYSQSQGKNWVSLSGSSTATPEPQGETNQDRTAQCDRECTPAGPPGMDTIASSNCGAPFGDWVGETLYACVEAE